MFIALHVATPELTQSKEQQLRLNEDGSSARIDDFLIAVSRDACKAPSPCKPKIGLEKINSKMPATLARTEVGGDGRIELPLPIPISDGEGGLYANLALRWIEPCSVERTEGCGKEPRLSAHYEGSRLRDLPKIQAKGW